MSNNKSFEQVKEFHLAFGHTVSEKPTAIPVETAIKRATWKAEEIVEFLHATVAGEAHSFLELIDELKESIDSAVNKQMLEGPYKNKSEFEILVRQMDALTDISYFNYGSFNVAGVDPEPLFEIIQEANMGKLDPETGKPIVRESDGKIMKPDCWEELYAPEPKLRKEILRQLES